MPLTSLPQQRSWWPTRCFVVLPQSAWLSREEYVDLVLFEGPVAVGCGLFRVRRSWQSQAKPSIDCVPI